MQFVSTTDTEARSFVAVKRGVALSRFAFPACESPAQSLEALGVRIREGLAPRGASSTHHVRITGLAGEDQI